MQKSMIAKSTGSKSLIVILCIILLIFAVTDLFLTAIVGHQILLVPNVDTFLIYIYSLVLIIEVIVALLVITFEIFDSKPFYLKLLLSFLAIISIVLKFVSKINVIIGSNISLFVTFVEFILILLILVPIRVRNKLNFYICC